MESHGVRLEYDASTRLELLTWVHQTLPRFATFISQLPRPNFQTAVVGSWRIGSWELTKQQAFDRATARNTMADEPRREHPRIVEHEQIARAQMVSQLRE